MYVKWFIIGKWKICWFSQSSIHWTLFIKNNMVKHWNDCLVARSRILSLKNSLLFLAISMLSFIDRHPILHACANIPQHPQFFNRLFMIYIICSTICLFNTMPSTEHGDTYCFVHIYSTTLYAAHITVHVIQKMYTNVSYHALNTKHIIFYIGTAQQIFL